MSSQPLKHASLAVIALTLCLAPVARAETPADALRPTGKWTAPMHGNAQTPPMGWNSYNAFGIERPTSELAALAAQRGTPIARLLVVVDDPMSKEAADRIRASLKWRDVPPF